jgi:hypothetical protein
MTYQYYFLSEGPRLIQEGRLSPGLSLWQLRRMVAAAEKKKLAHNGQPIAYRDPMRGGYYRFCPELIMQYCPGGPRSVVVAGESKNPAILAARRTNR